MEIPTSLVGWRPSQVLFGLRTVFHPSGRLGPVSRPKPPAASRTLLFLRLYRKCSEGGVKLLQMKNFLCVTPWRWCKVGVAAWQCPSLSYWWVAAGPSGFPVQRRVPPETAVVLIVSQIPQIPNTQRRYPNLGDLVPPHGRLSLNSCVDFIPGLFCFLTGAI